MTTNFTQMQNGPYGQQQSPPPAQAMNIDPELDAKITELYGTSRDSPVGLARRCNRVVTHSVKHTATRVAP
jgi:hypothetical protein